MAGSNDQPEVPPGGRLSRAKGLIERLAIPDCQRGPGRSSESSRLNRECSGSLGCPRELLLPTGRVLPLRKDDSGALCCGLRSGRPRSRARGDRIEARSAARTSIAVGEETICCLDLMDDRPGATGGCTLCRTGLGSDVDDTSAGSLLLARPLQKRVIRISIFDGDAYAHLALGTQWSGKVAQG